MTTSLEMLEDTELILNEYWRKKKSKKNPTNKTKHKKSRQTRIEQRGYEKASWKQSN